MGDEQQVDVAERGEDAAAVAAGRGDREGFNVVRPPVGGGGAKEKDGGVM